MIVPDKTIAAIPLVFLNNDPDLHEIDLFKYLRPLNMTHKRDWFAHQFYRCLPLSIGNMQGFSISLPFSVDIFWNGGNSKQDINISKHQDRDVEDVFANSFDITSHFGYGIVTINTPVLFKTPPGVNLMTIAAPNFPLPGLSPMTGVIETDNLQFTFTFNLKIDFPNMPITIKKDYPVSAVIPIPRYFCDSFELVNAYSIFDKNIIRKELDIYQEYSKKREAVLSNKEATDLLYLKGLDINNNKFIDHQLPRKTK